MGFAGYPTLRLMALAETGTRGLLGAALGSAADRDEATVARRLLHLLGPGMLILLDRAFDAQRVPAARSPPPGRCCWRGPSPPATLSSWVTCRTAPTCRDLGGLAVRIIEASVTVTGADGSRVRGQLPADHHADWTTAGSRPPRWSGSITSGGRSSRRISRCGTPCSRAACCARATGPAWSRRPGPCSPSTSCCAWPWSPRSRPGPGTDPDRASFTTALEAARDQLTAAARDLPGRPGRPARRRSAGPCWPPCCPPAAPGSAPARSNAPPPGTSTATTAARAHPAAITAIDIAISTPPVDLQARPDPLRPQHAPAASPAHPPGPGHRDHHQPPPARVERPRTSRPPRRQTPEHAHPARRMDTAGILHPHRLRHLPPQHAALRYPLDKPARSLTSRL